MTVDAVEVQINISDKYVPQTDSNCVLIFDEFAIDSSDKLVANTYFTSNGEATGSSLRVKSFTTLTDLGKVFKSTTVIYEKAEAYFGQNNVVMVLVGRKDPADLTIEDALDSIKQENDNWKGLVSTYGALADADEAQNRTDIEDISDWAGANNKIYCALTKDSDSISASRETDIGSILKTKSADNAFVIYTNNYDSVNHKFTAHQDAILAYGLTFRAGTTLFEDKTLTNVAITQGLDSTAINALASKNINIYIEDHGINVFKGNTLASGRFIDTKLFAIFLKKDIETNIRLLQINKSNSGKKIPYTDNGVEQYGSILTLIFERELKLGTLTPFIKYVNGNPQIHKYVISTLPISQVTDEEKNSREYNYLDFEIRYSSGIQKVKITGNMLV